MFETGSGKIILINKAACKLLGYSKKELLSKLISNIFPANNSNLKKKPEQKMNAADHGGLLIAKGKSAKEFPCKVSYGVFIDEYELKKGIITITDMTESLLDQKKIDTKNQKIVDDNIILANSKQKRIDISKEKIVADNIELAKTKQKVIDTKTKKKVDNAIILAKSKQKRIDTRKQKIVDDNIEVAITKQKVIDTKKKREVDNAIVLAKAKQKRIDTSKEKIVADNIVLARTKQEVIDIKKNKSVEDAIVLARSKQKRIDTYNKKVVADNIVLAKTRQKKIDIENNKIVSDNIILAQAKSAKEKLGYENDGRNKLRAEIEEHFRIMFDLSSDVLFDSDLLADTVTVNKAYEKEFGYKRKRKTGTATDWAIHIHPADKEGVMKDYYRMLKSKDTEWKFAYRFLRADDSVANVYSNRIILRDAHRKAYRMIGSMQDISKQKVLEEKLEQEIKLKEKQIAEASEDAKDAERSDIGKELHDNVNQLLGVSKLYLDMAKRGDDNSKMYLSRSSEYTLQAIEEIRKLTKALTASTIRDLGLCEAIENMVRDTMETTPVKIIFSLGSFMERSVNDKFKLNILRIVQEQMNNIIKHAEATKVSISLLQNNKTIKLTISDNGIGFDIRRKRKGIGVANIKSRVSTYNGTTDFITEPGKGCVLTATFSATDITLIRA